MREALDTLIGRLPWTLETLAAWAGVSYDTARSWSTGRRNPSPEARRRLARALRAEARALGALADRIAREAERTTPRRA